ncbi:MAG: helix-turn-helix transcriptional regulator [Frankiales bacterium]|nr:helix-turn-helix transcriptional regulator [Frankiales bacterium]
MSTTSPPAAAVGPMLREWRSRRRVSQLELSSETGVSTRHLSFIETGRARPSRDMVMRLAEYLELPLRERNTLLLAAGHAPEFPQTPLSAESMRDVRRSLQSLVDAHEPCPALVADHAWNLVLANSAALSFTEGVPDELMADPINIIRLVMHPDGLSSRVANFADYSEHVLIRLQRQLRATGDPAIAELIRECQAYPGVGRPRGSTHAIAPVLALRLSAGDDVLSFFTVVSTLGAPYDVTLDEIVIESFFPADDATARAIGMHPTP